MRSFVVVRRQPERCVKPVGIDQEFIGASKLILTRILETHPGQHAAEAAKTPLERK